MTAVPEWARARGQGLNHFPVIDPARSALVVIDMQRGFIAPGEVFANPRAEAIIPAVNWLVRAFRAVGAPVIWTRQTVSEAPPLAMPTWQYDPADPFVARAMADLAPGAAGHGLHPAMAVRPDDRVLDKYRYSAFLCPDRGLARALEERGVELIVIAGTLTNICCESTARDGNMLGYKVVVAADATAAVTPEEEAAALLNLCIGFADVASVAEIGARLAAA